MIIATPIGDVHRHLANWEGGIGNKVWIATMRIKNYIRGFSLIASMNVTPYTIVYGDMMKGEDSFTTMLLQQVLQWVS